MPIALRVSGDGSNTWAGSSIQVDDLTNPAETWSYTSDLGLARASLIAVADSFTDWANDAGRAWTGVVTFSYTVDIGGGGSSWDDAQDAGVTLTATASVGWTFSGGITSLTDFANSAAASSRSATTVFGTVGGRWGVMAWVRANADRGISGGASGLLPHSTASASRRPTCESVLTHGQLRTLADARLANPSQQGRQAHVYQDHEAAWRLVSLGKIKQRRQGPTLYAVNAEVLG